MDDQNTDPLPVITEEDYIPDQELDEAHLIKERPALPLEASPSASMAPSGVVPPVAATSNSSDMTAGTVSTTEMVEQVPSGEESYIPAQSMQQTTAQMVLLDRHTFVVC